MLNAWLGLNSKGVYTSPVCGLLLPRQNGKNAVIEMRELHGAVLLGEKILHTAHEVKTARKAFNRLLSFFENKRQYPDLVARVKTIRKTNGQEAIELKNGGSIEFSARSTGAARGFTVDVVICDEAQFLTDEQLKALQYTKSAAPLNNPQIIYTGTPPSVDMEAAVFRRVRKRALKQKPISKGICWHEWSVKEIGDVTDRTRWYETNPALGIRIKESTIEDELLSSSAEDFACERLSYWAEVGGTRILGAKEWNALAIDTPPEDGKLGYGVKFSVDGQTVSVAVAVKPKQGTPFIEVKEYRSQVEGITWLADYIDERRKTAAVVVIDGLSGAGTLIDELKERKFPPKALIAPSAHEVATAASSFLNAIHEKKLNHFDQEQLNESALNAQKRQIGKAGAWGWGGIGDTDVTLVEACTLAYWGVMTTKRNPGKGSRIL